MLNKYRYLFVTTLVTFSAITSNAQDDFFEPTSSIGGYGELHYNNNRTSDSKLLDFHRFVLFYGYQWTDQWSFYSELELEHNFVKNGQGELELEQAFVDFHPSEVFGFRVGVVLPSVGFINENHEPPRFLSVERPDYAKNIIPTTWFGNGLSVYGNVNNFNYKFTVMEGLDGDKVNTSSGIRGGRQKGYKANAEKLLYNLRVDYIGVLGARFGFSYSMNDAPSQNGNLGINILDLHAQYSANNIYSVFEYGRISYDVGPLKTSTGYYFDLGYNVGSFGNFPTEIIPWFRWTDYNPAHETLAGGDSERATHYKNGWLV